MLLNDGYRRSWTSAYFEEYERNNPGSTAGTACICTWTGITLRTFRSQGPYSPLLGLTNRRISLTVSARL